MEQKIFGITDNVNPFIATMSFSNSVLECTARTKEPIFEYLYLSTFYSSRLFVLEFL